MPYMICAHRKLFFTTVILFLLFSIANVLSQGIIPLKVILNGEDAGDFFLVLTSDGDVLMKREDLQKNNLKPGIGKDITFNGETYVSLRSIPDLNFSINEQKASIEINAASHLFITQTVDASYAKPYKVYYPKETSAFLNYGFLYNSENSAYDVATEVGIHFQDYLGTSTFNYHKDDFEDKMVRLLTSIRTDDRKNLTTSILGDFPAISGVLGSAPLLGGFNFSKNYDIDPYYLRFPPLTLSGALIYPSKAELYVNDMLVKRETLSPGQFLFENIPAEVGLGSTKIVIRDIFGNERVITRPFYYSDALLKPGLQEFSYSLGFLRKDFGEKSFSYGDLALLAFHNYGFTNSLKAGYAMELSKDTQQLGPTASILLPNAGVLDLSFTASNSNGKTGIGGFLAHSFRSRYIDTFLSVTSLTKDFSNLTVKPSDEKPSFQFTGAIGFHSNDIGSIVGQYSSTHFYMGPDTSVLSLSYTRVITKRATLFITATRSETEGTETKDELFCGLNIYFGKDISGLFSYTNSGGENVEKATITKSLPTGTGFGFTADIENSKEQTDIAGEVSYQNNYGIYSVGYRKFGGEDSFEASVAGGIGYIDKSLFLSRPMSDGFAKVKVGDLEGVRVYSYGNEVTRTDSKGEAIIPVIQSFNDNRVDIENEDIPINYSITALTSYINPSYRSGGVVNFDVKRIQSFIGNIYVIENGKKLPVEFTVIRVQFKDKSIEGLVGRNGEFYVENVPPGKHIATIIYNGKEYVFDIIFPESREMQINLGEIICKIKD